LNVPRYITLPFFFILDNHFPVLLSNLAPEGFVPLVILSLCEITLRLDKTLLDLLLSIWSITKSETLPVGSIPLKA